MVKLLYKFLVYRDCCTAKGALWLVAQLMCYYIDLRMRGRFLIIQKITIQ